MLVGNDDQAKINQGIYNHFFGSLEPLKNLTRLRQLDINNTDINSGVEYLPNGLRGVHKIAYSAQARPESKIKEIKWQLDLFTSGTQKNWEELNFTLADIKFWIETGIKAGDYIFADYLRWKGYVPGQSLNWHGLYKLRKEYMEALKKQKWFWESEITEFDLFQRWKTTHPKEQVNSLEAEYEVIEKPNEDRVEVKQNQQVAQILQPIPGPSNK